MEWRDDIENAPHDGSPVLVAWHDPYWGWVLGWAMWISVKGIDGWIARGFFDPPGELGLAHPTHWQEINPPEPDNA